MFIDKINIEKKKLNVISVGKERCFFDATSHEIDMKQKLIKIGLGIRLWTFACPVFQSLFDFFSKV